MEESREQRQNGGANSEQVNPQDDFVYLKDQPQGQQERDRDAMPRQEVDPSRELDQQQKRDHSEEQG